MKSREIEARAGARAPTPRPLVRVLEHAVLLWERPLAASVMAILAYVVLALHYRPLWPATGFAYFNYLADALLHGQLSLRIIPPSTHDLSYFHGRYYLYWGPLPALVALPFVALFGVQFSDIVLTIALAGLDVALVALVLRSACRRRVVRLSRLQRALLVLGFALGTVHVTLAPFARVWFTAQIVGFLCVCLAYLATLSLRDASAFGLTGLALAAALLTRNHLIFTGVWPACYLVHQHRRTERARLVRRMALGLSPIVLAVGLLGYYDWRRFGSVFDNGLAYHRMAALFVDNFRRYGAFNLHYIPENFFYQFIFYPYPLGSHTAYGGSLFLLTPIFFAAVPGIASGRPRWSIVALLASIGLVALPILTLMGTGFIQFGPRYTLDFTLPLLLLSAYGMRRWPTWLVALLTAVAIVHYVYGTLFLMTLHI